jgi:hypothetical protein
MTNTAAETWWATLSKREQNRRKDELVRELGARVARQSPDHGKIR